MLSKGEAMYFISPIKDIVDCGEFEEALG